MGEWHYGNTGPFVFCSCENCWKRRYPAKCMKTNTNNSNVSWRILENSEKAGIFSGNLFWIVLTCFGLKVYTKNVKCTVTTNSSAIVSSSSSPFKSRVSCILGTWILVAFTKFTNFYGINGLAFQISMWGLAECNYRAQVILNIRFFKLNTNFQIESFESRVPFRGFEKKHHESSMNDHGN